MYHHMDNIVSCWSRTFFNQMSCLSNYCRIYATAKWITVFSI